MFYIILLLNEIHESYGDTMNIDSIRNENHNQIPEGYQILSTEKNIYILGTDYIDIVKNNFSKFNVEYKGIISCPVDIKNKITNDNIIAFDEITSIENPVIVICFSWFRNPDFLKNILSMENVNKVYILEGAEYYYRTIAYPEKKFFKHPKLYFVDSYYKKIFERKLTFEYFMENRNRFVETFEWLCDDLSKETMLTYLNGHINLKMFPMSSLKDNNPQYFPSDIYKLSNNEVYVDCGGWDGDTVNEFLKQTNNKYKNIYIFEPDKRMVPKLKDNLGVDVKYTLFEKGVYNQTCKLGFDVSACGTISEDSSDNTIEVTRIDDVINEKISFIKMDIEGAEMSALQGAEKTLRKSLPIMAICVYHKREDLITIPQFIKSLNPNYNLYLRAYYDYVSEVVLYAIPK